MRGRFAIVRTTQVVVGIAAVIVPSLKVNLLLQTAGFSPDLFLGN